MAAVGTFHARESVALADDTYRAVTIREGSRGSILVWAGRLCPSAIAKESNEIQEGDYAQRETVNFVKWADVWRYFEGREYALLVSQIRDAVEILLASEDGAQNEN